MNTLTGQELETLLDGYHRLSHEFELLGGYTYRSEVTGILKGLGFSESEFDRADERAFRRSEDARVAGEAPCDKAGRPAFGRADQPSGYGIDPVAGGISDEL